MRPSKPFKANETSVTAPSRPQVTPSHSQQSLPFCFQDAGEATITRQTTEELQEGLLLLLCARTGGRGQGDQQHKGKEC